MGLTLRQAERYPSWYECKALGLVDLDYDDDGDDDLDPDDLDGLHDPVGEDDGDDLDDIDDYDPELDEFRDEPPPHYGHNGNCVE